MAAEDRKDRPGKGRGRGLRRRREPVEVGYTDGFGDVPDDDEGDGSAGVREPRHPRPLGPMAGAGVLPEPTPVLVAHLPDPRC
ncbi:hypothetical protein [Goodfellowiella coeruleoviolacea]|uniref:Uncharacterized protein n=1 Tax=Goodfellowiella coeruleoviolacea TaxID=334858 RepID=A0AAE3KK97_9PSEU|nr:hypothetical protein [Goodfellowiella coeruleoviolacea]MCP2165203.1 hypothetical protein [Goodfellowiella coeruleoviolacea]